MFTAITNSQINNVNIKLIKVIDLINSNHFYPKVIEIFYKSILLIENVVSLKNIFIQT